MKFGCGSRRMEANAVHLMMSKTNDLFNSFYIIFVLIPTLQAKGSNCYIVLFVTPVCIAICTGMTAKNFLEVCTTDGPVLKSSKIL